MARVRLEDIHKTYANGFQAVKGIDLEIADGELVVLVGPSGCGKSTALRLIAGLETPTRGRITIGDRDVTNVRVQDRDVAMVFQSYALYPHRTVRQNLAFALELRRVDRAAIERRVAAVSAMLGLEPLLDRKPAQLSGGQRQRVALGRAIVREPQVFLFDEPLSNLDARLRVQTRTELARLHRRLGATMVYVTHDQEEAMTLGDRIAVLEAGRLQQCGPPLEVYRRPANVFVAGFVGSPSMNFLDERIGAVLGAPPEVLCAIRPEDIELTDPEPAAVSGRVGVVERLGSSTVAHIDVDGSNVRVTLNADERVEEDHSVGLRLPLDRLHRFDRETGTRLTGFDAETA